MSKKKEQRTEDESSKKKKKRREDELSKKKKQQTEDESSSRSSSSSDGRRSEAQRYTWEKEGKVISTVLTELKEEIRKLSKKHTEQLEKLTEKVNVLTEKVNEQSKMLELRTKGTSGDDSAASRSQSNQLQPPRYRLEFTSGVIDKIEKGQNIEISVALVDCSNDQIVENDPLASATLELVVVNAEFNQHDNQYNWSREDFESNIKKARQRNSATGDVNQSVKSIVSNGRFNLVHGVKCHSGSKIFSNSGNKKVRLGVMVVSPIEERVLEGLSNPFFVRGHDRPNRLCKLRDSRSNTQGIYDGHQEQNGPMPNMQNPSGPNSTQGLGDLNGGQPHLPTSGNRAIHPTEPSTNLEQQVSIQPYQGPNRPIMTGSMYNQPAAGQVSVSDYIMDADNRYYMLALGNGMQFDANQIARPVHLVWDRPNVEPSKRWNLLDQLMPLYRCQPKFNNCSLPTMRFMTENFGSLTVVPKEVMQTRRKRGVLIEPLEPDDSDEEPPLKRKLHSKYRLRFVNKVCETYYTRERIKAYDGNLLKVALFDQNNTRITSGHLSSASIEVVVLHGDFNVDGEDYWSSEEFNRCVVCQLPGKEASVLGGDSILVLADGEACIDDAFFQIASFWARTGKFKMAVMLASTPDERIEEGISEPFRVHDRGLEGLPPGFRFHPTDEELIVDYLCQRGAAKPCPALIMAEIDIYKFDPWELPARAVFGEREWYFFTPRDRKYPNNARPNRAAGSGYWKATGTDQLITNSIGMTTLGFKKTLNFYQGRPPKGEKTNWIMHEYRHARANTSSTTSLRLDECVLCRIFQKTDQLPPSQSIYDGVLGQLPPSQSIYDEVLGQLPPVFSSYTGLPPGFRFFPTDGELIFHYLRNRATAVPCLAPIIAEVDIYEFEPWDLPAKAVCGEREWYFCHPQRKYPTGSSTNRATASGYWKATGRDETITPSAADNKMLGFRKRLVFYRGRAPKGIRTSWMMDEYRLADSILESTINSTEGSSSNSSTWVNWFLCRIFKQTTRRLINKDLHPAGTARPLQGDSVSDMDALFDNPPCDMPLPPLRHDRLKLWRCFMTDDEA